MMFDRCLTLQTNFSLIHVICQTAYIIFTIRFRKGVMKSGDISGTHRENMGGFVWGSSIYDILLKLFILNTSFPLVQPSSLRSLTSSVFYSPPYPFAGTSLMEAPK